MHEAAHWRRNFCNFSEKLWQTAMYRSILIICRKSKIVFSLQQEEYLIFYTNIIFDKNVYNIILQKNITIFFESMYRQEDNKFLNKQIISSKKSYDYFLLILKDK